MFKTVLESFINPERELCLPAKEINWASLEKEFAPLYGTVGRPSIGSVPISVSGVAGLHQSFTSQNYSFQLNLLDYENNSTNC
jgi:hypothetical protein